MRLFTVALAVWVDPRWLRNARRSWRVRRYWWALAAVRPRGAPDPRPGRWGALRAWLGAGRWSLHVLAFDVHVRLEGVKRGQ